MARKRLIKPIILDERTIDTVSATPSKSLSGPDVSKVRNAPRPRRPRVQHQSITEPQNNPDPSILLTPEELGIPTSLTETPTQHALPVIDDPIHKSSETIDQDSAFFPGIGAGLDPNEPSLDPDKPLPQISNPKPRSIGGSDLERMLKIKWSEFIPKSHAPFPKQLAALMLADSREVFFGGAAGGGKSDWLLMEALRFADMPTF